jgi:hypothetical protein
MGIMNFTDRFIRLPIKVYDTKDAELTGNPQYFDNVMAALPFEISNYKTAVDEDNDDAECVSVKMKNGDSYYVYMTLKEFEKALNEHQANI